MTFDITLRRMSSPVPQHYMCQAENIEEAVALAREQYPGCLVIHVLLINR